MILRLLASTALIYKSGFELAIKRETINFLSTTLYSCHEYQRGRTSWTESDLGIGGSEATLQ